MHTNEHCVQKIVRLFNIERLSVSNAHSSLKTDTAVRKSASRAMVGVNGEGTESLKYPTELYAYIRDRAPKRSTVAPSKMSGGPKIGICEDGSGRTPVSSLGRDATSRHGFRSLENVSIRLGAVSKDSHFPQSAQALPAWAATKHNRTVNPRRRVSTLLAERQDGTRSKAAAMSYREPEGLVHQQTIKRKPRRMTIYIPSDDTTIQTIHPRMISCRNEISEQPESLKEISPASDLVNHRVVYGKAYWKAAKGSAGVIAARRVPLQTLSTFKQETTAVPDRFGNGGGKENIPPARLERRLRLSTAKEIVSSGQDYKSDSTTDRVGTVVNDLDAAGCRSTALFRAVCSRRINRCGRLRSSRNLKPSLEKHGF